MSDISYLLIYNSHNGESIKIPKPIRFHTLSEFKSFLINSFGIDHLDNLFLLTSFGIKPNFHLLNELNDVFIYDKRLFSADVENEVLKSYEEAQYQRDSPQKAVLNQNDKSIREMTNNLKINYNWTRSTLRDCLKTEENNKELTREINIVFTSLNLIFQFGTNFINEIEKNFNNYLNYIKLINFKTLHKSWTDHFINLGKFPTFTIKDHPIQLASFVNTKQLKKSSDYVALNLPAIVQKFNSMSDVINNVGDEKVAIDRQIEKLRNESISEFKDRKSNYLITQIQDRCKQISNDVEMMTNSTSVNIPSIYKNHLSSSQEIFEMVVQIYNYNIKLSEFKMKLFHDSLNIFRNIADLQMRMVNIKNELKIMTTPNETNETTPLSFETINTIKKYEDYLSLTIDLPLLFGFMLIEKRRQFEWYDFYSKGVVSNVSEQLSTIIDHEKLFRKIWLKKFGNFLYMLNDEPMTVTLPNIDVTLVGNMHDNFNVLKDLKVEREDITKYIATLESTNTSKNFATVLNKNFKDLVRSTNNMKKITKMISSLSTFTSIQSEEKLKIIQRDDDIENEADFDLNLIKGLKSRIKKLENLLHQQEYKKLTSWPVVRNGNTDNRISLIMEPVKNDTRVQPSPTLLLQRRNTTANAKSPNQSNVLDTSGIDKHLDNIRLKKENGEISNENNRLIEENRLLVEENQKLVDKNRNLADRSSGLEDKNEDMLKEMKSKDDLIASLTLQIETLHKQHEIDVGEHESEYNKQTERLKASLKKNEILESEIKKANEQFVSFKSANQSTSTEVSSLQSKLDSTESKVTSLQSKLDSSESKITSLQEHLAKFTELNTNSSQEISSLNKTISSLRGELNDAVVMKNDLLSNMSSKETSFTQERISLENEIKKLHAKVDEITEDYENLMELTQIKQGRNDVLINDLNNIIISLLNDIKKVMENVYEYFLEFCFVLESMGLLLIKDNSTYKITRVKGLRAKKGEDNDILIIYTDMPSSKVIEEIAKNMDWVNAMDLNSILAEKSQDSPEIKTSADTSIETSADEESKLTEQSLKLKSLFDNHFNAEKSPFKEFVTKISFKDHVQLQEDSISSTRFFLNAISKRFRDVEGFAKRQTKDNKLKQQEIIKLTNYLHSKITMNGFQKNDLVLFLPTRIDRANEVFEDFQPWAAFNIGAPHYFLKVENEQDFREKDWMVGRLKEISENKVTEENVGDREANPFQLSVGVTWFLVEATEQK
jgi:Chromosome segregation ATPases